MLGSWSEYAVLRKTSFGFIWDKLKIFKSWVWATFKTPTLGVDTFSELVFYIIKRLICAQTQDLQILKKFSMSQMNLKEVFHNTAYYIADHSL